MKASENQRLSIERMTDTAKLRIEVETGPRFEIFYAMHKLLSPPAPAVEKWRRSARERLGQRVLDGAVEIAPHPLMWAVLADSTLTESGVHSFEDLIDAINARPAEEFKATILAGVPDVRGSDLVKTFERQLGDPDSYRRRLISVLREFWSRAFEEDIATLRPELDRIARQLVAATGRLAREGAGAGAELGIPIEIDSDADTVTAGRTGYSIPIARAGRIVLLPSAFNLNRWWAKRDDGSNPVDFFFPFNDRTIGPNDAVAEAARRRPASSTGIGSVAAAVDSNLRPEQVFRALGDTTRYAIATILARSPTTPSDLSRQLKVSRPTITHHVHALRDAGLIVEGAADGTLGLDRSKLEQLSAVAVDTLFSSEGKLKLSRTRKKIR